MPTEYSAAAFAAVRLTLMLSLIPCIGCSNTEPARVQKAALPDVWPVVMSVNGAANDIVEAHDAALLSDGSLVVAHSGEQEILWFDRAGRLSRKTGRRGSGPGEFRGLNSVVVMRGDTILAYDGRLSRLTVLSAAGELVRTQQLQALVPPSAKLVGRLGLGSLVFLRESIPLPRERKTGVSTDSTSLVVVDTAAKGARDIGSVPLRSVLVDGVGAGLFVMSSPLPSTASIGVCGDSLLIAFGDTNVLQWRGTQTDEGKRTVSLALKRVPVTREALDSLLNASRRGGTTDLTVRARQAVSRHSTELRRPFFSRGALDVDGTVWILLDQLENTGAGQWRNVDARGNWTDVPPIPGAGRILQMTRSSVLIHSNDANGLDVFSIISRPVPWPDDRCSNGLPGTATAGLVG